jgi:hypothetical protein
MPGGGALGKSNTGTHTLAGNGSGLAVVVTPEPAAALLGSLGMLSLLRRRRA